MILWWLACSGSTGPAAVPDGDAIALRVQAPITLELPDKSRSAEPTQEIVLDQWTWGGSSRAGADKWNHAIPVRPRSMFFMRPKPGMAMTMGGEDVPFGPGGPDKAAWGYDADTLHLFLPKGEKPTQAITFRYPAATDRERSLHLEWAGTDAQSFTNRQIQDGFDARAGLLLPAPGVISWELDLPPAAELHLAPGIAQPEQLDGTPSDGARLVVELKAGDEVAIAHREDLQVGVFPYRRVDLSRWSGQRVTLTLRSEPGAHNHADHVFLGEPVVASRKANPRTVLMVFIDTLRPDHMSLYGYPRDTTAAIDHLADNAIVFDAARTIAPWTLPSAQTIVTGRQPEAYASAPTIQEQLRDAGWATAFFAGNVYLSANFDMHRGWDFHRVGMWPLAEDVTNDALSWLDERAGRDTLLQVHYMGVHLPYREPRGYRHLYAGDGPAGLQGEFHLPDLRRAKLKSKEDRQYVRDRYDNNIRYVTDQVQRLLARLDDNDILLLYSDHGEEFWDHGQVEHGHTVHEELLRVPLVLRAPGLPGGVRISETVSLLDIAPTVLDLVGVEPAEAMDGWSLAPLARNDAGAAERFASRDHAFGRPLYGRERWGVVTGSDKWWTHGGAQWQYNLETDAQERNNLLARRTSDTSEPYRDRLGAALGLSVPVSYRLAASAHRGGGRNAKELEAVCTVRGGVRRAWVGADPLENVVAEAEIIPASVGFDLVAAWAPQPPHDRPADIEGYGAARFRWDGPGPREVYFTPEAGVAEIGDGVQCSARYCVAGDCTAYSAVSPERDPTWRDVPITTLRWDSARSLEWTPAYVPMDPDRIRARDAEANEALRAMGYTEEDDRGE